MRARSISHRTVAGLVSVLVTAATASAAVVIAPAPAAAVPGLTVVSSHSGDGSASPKSALAQCPPGTVVVGGGGVVTGGPGVPERTLLVGMRPIVSFFGTGFQVIGSADEIGTDGGWVVEAVAVCAPAPPGLEYVWAHSPAGSASTQTAVATCPKGKNVLGTGGMVNGPQGQVGLRSIVPTPNPPTAVVVRGHEDATGTASTWSLTSWAICAVPPPGLQLVTSTGFDGGNLKWQPLDCPRNKYVHGVGGLAGGDPAHVKLRGAAPSGTPQSPLPTTMRAWANSDGNGPDEHWGVTAIAICAY